jgi:hypothetical protein
MNDLLFSDYGIEVLKRDGRFFIRYDAGEVAVQIEEELLRARQSEKIPTQHSYAFNKDR